MFMEDLGEITMSLTFKDVLSIWDDGQMIYQHMCKDFHFYNITV